jgi:chorismate mutase/prephenate dehydratase
MTDPTVKRLRDEISERDRAILDAVNERLELVTALRQHKLEVGLSFVDHDRERELLDELERANRGPLSAEGLRELFSQVLALTKREVADGGSAPSVES